MRVVRSGLGKKERGKEQADTSKNWISIFLIVTVVSLSFSHLINEKDPK